MGAGKTTVGRLLAEAMELTFVDLDERIEAAAGATVARIFEREGEPGFRARERAALVEASALEGVVVAAGGGVTISPANRELMAAAGTTVWLDADFELLVERLAAQPAGDRPLFGEPEQARALFESRLEGYREAELRIDVGRAEGPEAVAARVAGLLEEGRCDT